jgi:signal transduction histidine kinase
MTMSPRRELPVGLGLIAGLAILGFFFAQVSPGWRETRDWGTTAFEGLFFIFIFSWNLAVVPNWRSARTLSLGSLLLLVGSFADAFDNFFLEPRWENSFIENLSLTLGAGLFGVGIWFWVREKERLLEQIQIERDFEASLVPKLSHDLRVPLSNLIGMTGIVEEDPKFLEEPARRQGYLEIIQRGAKEMNLLIDNILETHRMKSGTVKLNPAAVSLAPLLDDALKDFHYKAKAKEIALVKDYPDGKLQLVADQIKIVRIVQNLLANAVKFSPKGGKITLKARVEDGLVAIRVMDEGPGLPPEQASAIVEEKVSPAGKAMASGDSFGLGLKVVREFVRLHGGRFWIEPNSPTGAQFCFTLPERRPAMGEDKA